MATFSQDLCGCFGNLSVCIITYFVPCYTQGKIAEKVGESCCLHCIFFLIPILNIVCATMVRGRVRQQKGIGGGVVGDCCTIWFCGLCALCQEAVEVDAFSGSIVREWLSQRTRPISTRDTDQLAASRFNIYNDIAKLRILECRIFDLGYNIECDLQEHPNLKHVSDVDRQISEPFNDHHWCFS